MIAMKADVDLVVVGASGWKNHEIRYVVEQLDQKISERIHFYGYIDNETLVELYQKATVFCAPSLHEGFGLIILEALASGTPVVTSRRGAIPEIFGDSVEYADPLSPGDMAEKILQIILDKNIQKKMIDQGKCYSAKYDISSSARKYVYIFESIMKGDCARRESI